MTALTRRGLLATAASVSAVRARAATAPVIKIGVLTDMSGPYKDLGGPNVVTCIRQAVQDVGVPASFTVEVLAADHQNKPDVGSAIARQWFDQDGVDCIADINNSAVAIALTTLCSDKDKLQLNTGAGTSALTNQYCTPNLVHWTFDTYQQGRTAVVPLVERGAKTWFFITADYAFGHNSQSDATRFIQDAGGKVVGAVAYPFASTTDHSSFIVQAQASGAQMVALAASGTDTINIIKQAHEFGLQRNGARIAGLGMFINDVHGVGLANAQGVVPERNVLLGHERSHARLHRPRPPEDEQHSAQPGTGRRLFRRVQLSSRRDANGTDGCKSLGPRRGGRAQAHEAR